MSPAPVSVSPWFRRGCALLAAAEGAILGWLALQAALTQMVPGWVAGLLGAGVLMVAWRPLWRSANIGALAFADTGPAPEMQVWSNGQRQPEQLPLRWSWWWGGRLVLLGLGQGRCAAWVLLDASGASAADLATFHRTLRDATSAQPEVGARW